ncbi:hypothetical protein A0H76_1988 [Hepatospora eriocheir]|uniref:Uncharacterized protein n=1 Tax=Hepatospora eriocheir TaxID=1081669 RepID=A0A1X0QG08_9MICR|nr:hypothetical protein A0H76_1988 [Hepatospora eriocheir]
MLHNTTYDISLDCAPIQLAFGRSRYYLNKIENIHKLLNIASNYMDKKSFKNLEWKKENRKSFNLLKQKFMSKIGKLVSYYQYILFYLRF